MSSQNIKNVTPAQKNSNSTSITNAFYKYSNSANLKKEPEQVLTQLKAADWSWDENNAFDKLLEINKNLPQVLQGAASSGSVDDFRFAEKLILLADTIRKHAKFQQWLHPCGCSKPVLVKTKVFKKAKAGTLAYEIQHQHFFKTSAVIYLCQLNELNDLLSLTLPEASSGSWRSQVQTEISDEVFEIANKLLEEGGEYQKVDSALEAARQLATSS